MITPNSPSEMRQVVFHSFQQYSADQLSDSEIEERVRVEEGRVVAYCYRTADLLAMWLVPLGLVQFYDSAGNMLQTLELTSPAPSVRRAA